MSGDRSFLDTNIFVCAADEADLKKAHRAQKLIADAAGSFDGVTSYQVVQEFVNVVLRRFSRPLGSAEVERYLSNVFPSLSIVHSSLGLYSSALHVQTRYRLSWYDALIVAAAVEADCRFLYSEELQHGQRFGSVTVKNPFL
ncbi:MAG: PIN domain-containing protein [Acidobacteriota bacterium]